MQKLNLKPEIIDEEAVIIFTCNLGPFTQLTLVAVDSDSVA